MKVKCKTCGGRGVVKLSVVLEEALRVVKSHPRESASDLARHVGIRAPAMHRRLSRLVEFGLIEIVQDEGGKVYQVK